MSEVFNPENYYWRSLREQSAFVPAWNAALWEAVKLILESKSRDEAVEAMRDLALR